MIMETQTTTTTETNTTTTTQTASLAILNQTNDPAAVGGTRLEGMTMNSTLTAEHAQDIDCLTADAIDETDTCTVCGAYHGDPCPECGGRAYHTDDCNHIDEED